MRRKLQNLTFNSPVVSEIERAFAAEMFSLQNREAVKQFGEMLKVCLGLGLLTFGHFRLDKWL